MEIIDALEKFYQYLYAEKGSSKTTVEAYDNDLKQFFKVFSNKASTDDFTSNDLSDYISVALNNGLSVSTVLRRLSSLRQFYSFLKREGIINIEIKKIDSPKVIKTLPNVLSYEEVDALLDAPNINKDDGIRDKAMLEIMYASGLRVSELLNLQMKNVNFLRSFIEVIGKGSKARRIPVGEFAMDYLAHYINNVRKRNIGANTKFVFLNRYGKTLSRQYFFKKIKAYAAQVGITSNVSPHTLRHSFATHMLENGAELISLQEMLGHENLSTTQIYTHISTKRIKSAYDLYINNK